MTEVYAGCKAILTEGPICKGKVVTVIRRADELTKEDFGKWWPIWEITEPIPWKKEGADEVVGFYCYAPERSMEVLPVSERIA